MQVVRTLNPTTFQQDAAGSLTHANPLPAGLEGFLVLVKQESGWAKNGDQAIRVTQFYAANGIDFVQRSAPEIILDEDFPAIGIVPAGTWAWGISIPDAGLTTRKMKIDYLFIKGGLRISGTLSVY